MPAARARWRGRVRRAVAGLPTAARACDRAGASIPSMAAVVATRSAMRAGSTRADRADRTPGFRARSYADRARSSGTPSRDRGAAARPSVTSRPPMQIRPAVGISSPATRRSTVLLPLPDGPTMTSSSPSAISSVRSRAAHVRRSDRPCSTCCSVIAATQPFTAPDVSPATMRRCATSTISRDRHASPPRPRRGSRPTAPDTGHGTARSPPARCSARAPA